MKRAMSRRPSGKGQRVWVVSLGIVRVCFKVDNGGYVNPSSYYHLMAVNADDKMGRMIELSRLSVLSAWYVFIS